MTDGPTSPEGEIPSAPPVERKGIFRKGFGHRTHKRNEALLRSSLQNTIVERDKAIETGDTDSLTGLANRRAFEKRLTEEAARLRRRKRTVPEAKTTIVELDLDEFKRLNDSMGHDAGDEHLKKVADSLREALRRDVDFAARPGGDEFVLILPDTDLAGAQTMWDTAINPVFIRNQIKASAGAAELDPKNPMGSYKRADIALYEAKKDPGRNGANMMRLGRVA